jgi:hypothetical protein
MLKHCAANRKRRRSALPNVCPYIRVYTMLKFLGLQWAPYIYDISRLRVKHFLVFRPLLACHTVSPHLSECKKTCVNVWHLKPKDCTSDPNGLPPHSSASGFNIYISLPPTFRGVQLFEVSTFPKCPPFRSVHLSEVSTSQQLKSYAPSLAFH